MYDIGTSELLHSVCVRIRQNAAVLGDRIPAGGINPDGSYEIHAGGWLDSFWVGMLLHAYQYTKDCFFLEAARNYQPFFRLRTQNSPALCKQNQWIPLDHDTGFLYSLSQVALYKLTGDAEAKGMALHAAGLLAGRFHPDGKFIRAWDTLPWDTDPAYIEEKKGKAIIDSMMNLPLLMWASQNGGRPEYAQTAGAHADTVQQYFCRKDGSFYHTYNFDPRTGLPTGGKTRQGYHDESAWSRGQAWAVYGFALMYRYTRENRYLETARQAAGYFMSHLGSIPVPPWDFNAAGNAFVPWDSSAGAIAASGLLELSSLTGDIQYERDAKRLLWGLTHFCLALDAENIQPILLHACGGPAYHKGREDRIVNRAVDCPFIFGDYFFVEALMKLNCREWIPFF